MVVGRSEAGDHTADDLTVEVRVEALEAGPLDAVYACNSPFDWRERRGIEELEATAKSYAASGVEFFVMMMYLSATPLNIAAGYMYEMTTQELWDQLAEEYGTPNNNLLYELRKNRLGIVQGDNSLVKYHSMLKRVWEEFSHYRPIPEGCSLAAVKVLKARDEEDKLIDFLMGLNSSYESMKDQILLLEPSPTVSKALNMLLKASKKINPTAFIAQMNETTAFIAQGNVQINPQSFSGSFNSLNNVGVQGGSGSQVENSALYSKNQNVPGKRNGQEKDTPLEMIDNVSNSWNPVPAFQPGGLNWNAMAQQLNFLQQEFNKYSKGKQPLNQEHNQVNFAHISDFAGPSD
ncbi:OLC1v1036052C1 [Oldenlandia corymbosa var. corymbosa]|uniref:OLC1v1036052C1 n=1 Tax=Oldenlandia corymbosa var. corymbosa TaxID=529605 RepID=A0AAV1CWZ4_OLDCO|nr:OLC1v1036052C1 [Oldenlandia corymbosa var. corymbosa]